MAATDMINARFGRDTIQLAASGLEQPWGMRQANRWEELARVW